MFSTGISNVGRTGGFVLRVTVIFNPSVVWIVAPVVMFTWIFVLRLVYMMFFYGKENTNTERQRERESPSMDCY